MEPQPLLAYHAWLALPQETRSKLVTLFNIPRTGESIVQVGVQIQGDTTFIGGRQQQDGHSPTDLYAITVAKMQDVLNNPDEHDFYILFNGVIENLNAILGIEPQPITPEDVIQPQAEVQPVSEPAFVPRDPEELLKKLPEETTIPNEPIDAKVKKQGRPAKAAK